MGRLSPAAAVGPVSWKRYNAVVGRHAPCVLVPDLGDIVVDNGDALHDVVELETVELEEAYE